MKNPFKSMTIWSLLAMIASAAPGGATDPLWAMLAGVGVPSQWVSGLQLAVFIAGAAGALHGRARADRPLGFGGVS